MKPSRLVTTLAVLCAGGVAYAALSVQPLFQEMAEPGQEHAIVLKGAGHWSGTLKMWSPGVDAPMESACTETVTPIGGLWTVSHFSSDAMGMPFTGSAVLGFDPAKGKFVGTWIDSMSTTLTPMEGDWDEEKQAIVMNYDMKMGDLTMNMRSETVNSADSYTCTFYDVTTGTPQRQMEISMTRNKLAEASAGR